MSCYPIFSFQGLISCIDGGILAGVFERLVKKFRQMRSGFPDLLLWDRRRHTFKVYFEFVVFFDGIGMIFNCRWWKLKVQTTDCR